MNSLKHRVNILKNLGYSEKYVASLDCSNPGLIVAQTGNVLSDASGHRISYSDLRKMSPSLFLQLINHKRGAL